MSVLLVSAASPYSSKVRIAAVYADIPHETKFVDTSRPNSEVTAANPLGKIPVLLTESDGAVFDSVVIIQYLNRASGGKLLPKNPAKRLEAERLEAIADGINDCAIAHVYERRQRPEALIYQGWLDKQWNKVSQALDFLEANPTKLPSRIHAGHIALAAALGYLTLRFPDWEKGRPKLKRYLKKFEAAHPELAAMLPKQA